MLYQQPILNLANGTIDRCELLLRLPDGRGTMITPDAFLPVAERFGLMLQIDTWVVQEAIRFVAAEQQAGRTVLVEVNLSGSSLTDANVLACIEAIFAHPLEKVKNRSGVRKVHFLHSG